MKKLLALLVFIAGTGYAWDYNDNNGEGSRPYKDIWGNTYKKSANLDKDSDGDGVINRYDYNDRNKNVQYDWQKDYSRPRKKIGW